MPGGKRHIWIAAILLLVLGGCLLLLLTFRGSQPPPSRREPDGTVITIRKVGYGKIYRDVAGNAWQRLAGRILPEKYSRRLGARVFSLTNTTDRTFVVVETTRPNGGLSGAPAMQLSIGTSILLKDDAGNVFSLLKDYEGLTSSNRAVEVFHVPLVSHQAHELRLQLYQWDMRKNGKAGTSAVFSTEFTVPNPAPRSAARWIAGSFPLTNEVGDLKVELLELHPLQGLRPSDPGANPFEQSTHARLRILKNGVTAEDWKVAGVTVLDEEGNAYVPSASGFPASDSIVFSGGFSSSETRKFRFALARISRDPPESATIKDVLVPGAGAPSITPVTVELHGFKLQIDRLTQKNQFEQINLMYHITPPPPAEFRHHVILKYTAPQGVEAVLYDYDGGYSSGANTGIGHGVRMPVESNRVNVTFTLTPVQWRSVEFLARPSPLATNSLSTGK